jgi:hypothetical protein
MANRHGSSGFVGNVLSGAIGGIIAAVVILVASLLFQGRLSNLATRFNPTCEHPAGLVEVRIQADDQADSPTFQVSDGDFGTMWQPQLEPSPAKSPHQAFFEPDPDTRTLDVRVPDNSHVRLVCANNGLANDRTHYQLYGKVRTVEVWGDNSTKHERTTLGVEPTESMQQMQEVGRNLGSPHAVHLRLVDTYAGETVTTFDPDDCDTLSAERKRQPDGETAELLYSRGCIRAAVPQAGISELVLFTDD